jgi:arsenite methyltransferase
MDTERIRHALRKRYAEVAEQPLGQFKYPVGRGSAEQLKYPAATLDAVPADVVEHFVGVGNPFSLGEPSAGCRVVDIGCGAGLDSQVAAHCVGSTGSVIGVDFSREMLAVARCGLAQTPLTNVTFVEGLAEALPVEDGWADMVISNGVLNLAACKSSAFAEIARVLRPGGRFQACDLVLVKALPDDLRMDEYAWSS